MLQVQGYVAQKFPCLKGLELCHISSISEETALEEWFVKGLATQSSKKILILKFKEEQRKTENIAHVINLRPDGRQNMFVSVVNWWDDSYSYPYFRYARDRAVKKRISQGKVPRLHGISVSAVEESFASLRFWGESDEESDE
jgi:hypothetical protein